MPDSKRPAGPSIPAWQRASQPSSDPESTEKPSAPTKDVETLSQATAAEDTSKSAESSSEELLAQARRFLRDPSIANASQDRKAAFLESKGVRKEEIDKLLSAPDSETQTTIPTSMPGSHRRATATPPSTTSQPSAQPPAQPARQKSADAPPIITYPEFLVHSRKSPPLVTTTLVLNTLTASATIMASIYGLSKYIIAPMHAQLTDARHELYQHSYNKVEEFNKKLEGAVSVIPPAAKPGHKRETSIDNSDVASDVETIDSDPTELFHRDFGTQTSPHHSRRASLASSSPSSPEDRISAQATKLTDLTNSLKDVLASREHSSTLESTTNSDLQDLRNYLTDLRYSSPYYGSTGGFSSSFSSAGGAAGTKTDDGFEKFRGEIRSFKGMLLSARNFPGRVDAYRGAVGSGAGGESSA